MKRRKGGKEEGRKERKKMKETRSTGKHKGRKDRLSLMQARKISRSRRCLTNLMEEVEQAEPFIMCWSCYPLMSPRLFLLQSSMSSASISARMKSGSALETPEAEMLREVYLVLWVIRKQLRELARRQERRRRRHMRSQASHTSRHSDPVQGLKQDARSPL